MNAAVLLSACVAVLQLGIGALLLAVARAPGWGRARDQQPAGLPATQRGDDRRVGEGEQRPPDLMESVDSALDGADRIRRVIDALRTYSRAGTGQHLPVSMESVVQAALRMAAHQLRDAGRVEMHFSTVPPVLGEEAKLVQVMVNLLLNAAQALSEGKTGRKGRVDIAVGTHGSDQALVEVRDNGPGISREDLRRLTQPYFTTRSNAGGAGLGLFLARGVVELHGGSLTIESLLGEGTLVRILLPAVQDSSKGNDLQSRGVHRLAEIAPLGVTRGVSAAG